MESFSYINNADPAYIEALYEDFKKDPSSVDAEWRKFFEGFDFAVSNASEFESRHNGKQTFAAEAEQGSLNLYQP